jgi:hypothetical protein
MLACRPRLIVIGEPGRPKLSRLNEYVKILVGTILGVKKIRKS